MSDWQPIETAPDNGEHVIIHRDGIMSVAYLLGGWFTYPGHIEMRDSETPTHWMPLPPPAQEKGK